LNNTNNTATATNNIDGGATTVARAGSDANDQDGYPATAADGSTDIQPPPASPLATTCNPQEECPTLAAQTTTP
jgi:hypothetical protein